MAKNTAWLTNTRREELKSNLIQDFGRDTLEMMRAHFESHPTMPGEKAFKERINQLLDEPTSVTQEEQEKLVSMYAETRIRETRFHGIENLNLCAQSIDAGQEKRQFRLERLTDYNEPGNTAPVQAYKIEAELRKVKDGVNVYAKNASNRYQKVGSLPNTFLTNNPMNVSKCKAEISVADFSNYKLLNVSQCVVIDTDKMSGDAVELSADMLAGLDDGLKL